MFLRINNDAGPFHRAPAASEAEPAQPAPGGAPMRLACRMFVLDQDDELYRLPRRTFELMLQTPGKHPLPRFAGSRVRMSDVAVEIRGQRPIRVVWSTFDLLVFDDRGFFDAQSFERHQRACAEVGLAAPIAEPMGNGTVIDAANRFVAQGGCWTPAPPLLRRIGAAALGRGKCRQL